MKITAICGHAIGSSFIIGVNIKKIMDKFGLSVEITHTDITNVDMQSADLFVIGKDMVRHLGNIHIPDYKFIILNSIVDEKELYSKMEEQLMNKKLIA